ncbi:olfactory receptor 6C2-like [Sarcophilus harrisii]|uniref:G-protein coupled receptors family 1 profile domain-containing protein n=1 Tax=Sarcophilus harrisii TaxID=9305 RepID=A0A7N4P9D2_SARHA|nr:olfactory receptor 6C2-like [Sarcophilus harrisii]
MQNHSGITLFILRGLTDDPHLQVLIFIFLFLTYMLSVTGNLTIITLTLVDPHLKTPMYFFLRNFSFLEVSFTSACIPRYLYSMSTGNKNVTYNACATQVFFITLLGSTELFLLSTMSFDHYVAICKPLHYTTIMSSKVCYQLILSSLLGSLMFILPPLSMGLQLEFCSSNIIDHFVCDSSSVLKISCLDTTFIKKVIVTFAVLLLMTTLVLVVLSYAYIVRTILKFPSAKQRKKAFSTCSSHMIVVSMTYGTCIFVYVKSPGKEELALEKAVSVLVTLVAPVMNPFIYTLRNKQVIQAFKDFVKRMAFVIKL